MATSIVDIANIALLNLGLSTIASMTESNDKARVMNARYDGVRRMVIREHQWNSAIRRASLAQLSDTPIWGFTRMHQLPSDFIRFVSLDDLDINYRMESHTTGRVIVSDESTLNIRYVFDIVNVGAMDDGLVEAIGARLAAEVALKLTGSQAKRTEMFTLYERKVSDARYYDSLEDRLQTMDGNTWLQSRISGNQLLNTSGTPTSGSQVL